MQSSGGHKPASNKMFQPFVFAAVKNLFYLNQKLTYSFTSLPQNSMQLLCGVLLQGNCLSLIYYAS